METCGVDCYPICDFCANYNFNPGPGGEYVSDGFCKKLEMKKDPDDSCEDFRCFKLERKGEKDERCFSNKEYDI